MPHHLSEERENLFPCMPTQIPVLENNRVGNTQPTAGLNTQEPQ